MDETADIAIVGAGAAGLAAAIFCAENAGGSKRVVVLDGAKKIGAKILVSGGGRCNVTHDRVAPRDFNGPRNIVKNILREFDERRTVSWFESMGVRLKREETGKMFPVSDDARTALDALVRRCGELGVELRTGHRVTDIRRESGVLSVVHSGSELRTHRVIAATGGRSLPKTGSDGTGWEIVRRLGHTVTATYPALVPLVLDGGFFHAKLSGVSHEVELSTFASDRAGSVRGRAGEVGDSDAPEGCDGPRADAWGSVRLVDRRRGSLLWTHFGVSGPVAMDASRFWVIARAEGYAPELRVSLLPGQRFEAVERWLIEGHRRAPRRMVVAILGDRLPRRVAEVLCDHLKIDGEIGQLPREARRGLVHALTGLVLPVVGDRGWNYAEVTAGGVPLSEVNPRTMESRIVPGLYLAGEILDCDGRIGGFNFQWAWATGYIAGKAVGTGVVVP